ncbi:MAG: aminotransferase class V-fold PLP-dependent enzyme [Salinirussus sp.]
MDAAELRAAIPALEHCTYLNTGATGPSPRPVVEALTDYVERHRYTAPCGSNPYEVAREAKTSARATIADFLGSTPEEIALTRNTVEGINHVATSIPWNPGDVVVRTDLEHSAGRLPWQRARDRHDIEVRVLETDAGRLDLDALKAAVADARLLVLSSLSWNYGTRLRVAEAVEIAHDAGARVLVDAVQSPGQVAVDVEDWGADFVVGSGHKWLLGTWGAGFFHIDTEALDALEPQRIGYRSVTDVDTDPYEYAPDASRFELGTTAIGPYVALQKAMELSEAVGMETIRPRILELAGRLAEGLGDRYLGPDPVESGLVTFEAQDPEALVERLSEAGIKIRWVPEPHACRASVHAFNTAAEIDALLEAL